MEKNRLVSRILKVFNDKTLRRLTIILLSLLLLIFIINLLLGQLVEGLLFATAILIQLVFIIKDL